MVFDITALSENEEITAYAQLNPFCSLGGANEGGWTELDESTYRYAPHPIIYEDILTINGLWPDANYLISGNVTVFRGTADAEVKLRLGEDNFDIYTITQVDIGRTFQAYGYTGVNTTLDLIAYNDLTVEFIVTDLTAVLITPNTELVDGNGIPLIDGNGVPLVARIPEG